MIVIPFLSEGQKVPLAGTLAGVVRNCYSRSPDAGVTVTIQAITQCFCGEYALVRLMNQNYPDTSYVVTLDSTGFGQISGVWKGSYQASMLQFGCSPVYLSNLTVNGDTTIILTPHSATPPPRNLTIDPQTLRACWLPPGLDTTVFLEKWNSAGFTQNQWAITGGVNWQISNTIGNPSPSAIFYWSPTCTNCDQYLTSKPIWGMDAPSVVLKYDIFLDAYGTTTVNTMAIEIWDGAQWSVLFTYTNQYGDIPWTTTWHDISACAQMDFKFRFHAQSEDTYDLNYWAVDNIEVHAKDAGGGPPECLAGYSVGCNMMLSAFTTDTCTQIPPEQLPYGQTCYFCVTAAYGEDSLVYGLSVPVCDSVTSQFLYPPTNLQGQAIESNAYLTWEKPSDANNNTPPGLTGYRIFRDYAFIHFIGDPDSLEYYDMDLDPGTYGYDILAVYDLTPYGFPGQTDESFFANHVTVPVAGGPILPFLENFNNGTFAYHEWDFEPGQGNWTIQAVKSSGTPPYADFSWDPIRTNYSYAMVSTSIDATAWECADLWLGFDLRLEDRFVTGTEKLKVEVRYDNTWHELAEFSNNGSFGWTHFQYSVSGAQGMGLKVRFTAYGESSENILHWGLDNIHIYGVCKPPSGLDFDWGFPQVFLYWTAPDCDGNGNNQVPMDFIYDDGTWEDGLRINPGYTSWIGTKFPISSTLSGTMESVDIQFVDNGTGSPQNFLVELFDQNKVSLGTSDVFSGNAPDVWINVPLPQIPFSGPVYAMVKYDNLPGNAYYLGCDTDGPYASQMLAWQYDGTTWTNPSYWPAGAVFMVRGHALVNSDVADSANLIGYNIYRTGLDGDPSFLKINPDPVPVPAYTDNIMEIQVNEVDYYITALFNSDNGTFICESPSSDTLFLFIESTGSLEGQGITIYPNPATGMVKISTTALMEAVELLNLYGSRLLYFEVNGMKEVELDVSKINPGMYYVRVCNASGMITRKILVAR